VINLCRLYSWQPCSTLGAWCVVTALCQAVANDPDLCHDHTSALDPMSTSFRMSRIAPDWPC